jgi:hypothetical protein
MKFASFVLLLAAAIASIAQGKDVIEECVK